MTQRINIPGIGIEEFPDDMPDEEISRIVMSKYGNKSENQNIPTAAQQGDMRLTPSLGHETPNAGQQKQPSGIANFLDQAAHNPLSQFVLGAGDQFVNAFKNMANMVSPKSLQAAPTQFGQGGAYNAGRVVGDIGAFIPVAGSAGAALKLAEGLPGLLGKGAARLGSAPVPGVHGAPLGALQTNALERALGGGGAITGRAIGSAGYGAAQTPEDRVVGGAEMGLTSALSDALLKKVSKYMPGQMFSKGINPEELIENLRVAKGTETGLGRVIGSPKLMQQHENVLANVPFSGVSDSQAEIAKKIMTKGEKILERYLGSEAPETVTEALGKELREGFKQQGKIHNQLYQIPNEIADDLNFKVETNKLGEIVKEFKGLVSSQEFLKHEGDTATILKKISGFDQGLKIGSGSLTETNVLAAKLRTLGYEYLSSPAMEDRRVGKILLSFGKALKDDVKESIEKSGSKELKEAFNDAETNYATKYVPFLDKEIYKFAMGNKDVEDIIPTFIKGGRNTDKGEQIGKLMDRLSPKGKNLVKYSYLSRALDENDQLNPMRLSTLLGKNNIGKKQKEALFNEPGEGQLLEDLAGLARLNPESFSKMVNQHTGKRALSALPYAVSSGLGSFAGHALGDPMLGAAAGFVAPSVLANIAHKGLSSEMIREQIVKAILRAEKNKNKQPFKRTSEILKSGIGSMLRPEGEQ